MTNTVRKAILMGIDMLIWFSVLLFAYGPLHEFHRASLVAAFLVMLITWNFVYQGYRSNFDYFSHLLKISFYLLGFLFFFSLGLGHLSEFVTLFSCWLIWIVAVAAIRRFAHGLRVKPRILLMPDIQKEMAGNKGEAIYAKLDEDFELRDFDYLVMSNMESYEEEWRRFVVHCQIVGVKVVSAQQYREIHHGKLAVSALKDAWVTVSFGRGGLYRHFKGVAERILVFLTLPISLPLMALVSLLVLIKMGRPVIFAQQRYGQDGNLFNIYKFRTMRHAHGKLVETGENDERITSLGLLLRKFRLDELPQLFNVLKGDMSLIGPRPEWVVTAEKFNHEIPVYYARHLVKPGITGWAQVKQGHTTGVKGNLEKLQYDLYYVKNFSFILDIKVLLLTIKSVFTGSGSR